MNLLKCFQVKEQIDLAQEGIIATLNQLSRERPSSSTPIRFKLRFGNKISIPVLTGKYILGENGNPLKIELIDENTNSIIKTGPQSSGRVEILALCVDTKSDEKVLNGCTNVFLSEGIGKVEEISFPQRAKWTPKCKYVLVARFVDEVDEISVTEAKSEVFAVIDKRNRNYEKHYPPTLSDKALHLVNIGKGGSYNKLKDNKIITVRDLLIENFKNTQNLKEILNMPEKKFYETIAHARTCEEVRKKYVYYIPGSQQHKGIVLNIEGELFGLILKHQFVPIDNLSGTQKDEWKKFVASALEHWEHVVHYNEHSFHNSSSHLVPCEPTLPIAVYDNTQPSTSCNVTISPSIPVGPSQINRSNDHMQPRIFNGLAILPNTPLETSQVNGIYGLISPITPNGSDILIGKSLTNNGYDPMQPSTPYASATSSNNLIGTSLFSPDSFIVMSHDTCQHEEEEHQVAAAPEDILPLHDTCSYTFEGLPNGARSGLTSNFDMEFGSHDTFGYPIEGLPNGASWGLTSNFDMEFGSHDTFGYPIEGLLDGASLGLTNNFTTEFGSQDPGFIIADISDPFERFGTEMLSKDPIKIWLLLIFVMRFSRRMKLEKSGRVRKRTRFY